MRRYNHFRVVFVLLTLDAHIIHVEVIFCVFIGSHLASSQNLSVHLCMEI